MNITSIGRRMPFNSFVRLTCSAIGLLLSISAFSGALAGVTDPNGVFPESPMTRPVPGSTFTDPAFGTSIRSLQIPPNQTMLVPEYSQIQAWNSDMTMIMLRTDNRHIVYETSTWTVKRDIYNGQCFRWSPVDPDAIYYYSANQLMKLRVSTGESQVVRAFPEYNSFDPNYSYEEISDDGRYIVILGSRKTDGRGEAFVYDIFNDIKHTPLVLPLYGDGSPRFPDWAGISPLGKFMLVQWGGGTARFRGLESYDLDGNYVGKVHTGIAHGDTVVGSDGKEYFVVDNANNSELLSGNHYIVKARIPVGVIFSSPDNVSVDRTATVAGGWTVPLLKLSWDLNMHISGRNIRNPGWVLVSTYRNDVPGWVPFEDEIFKLYLDSSDTSPHVERLAHHRTQSSVFASDPCAVEGTYWGQPHATVKPDGTQFLYGSNWRRMCDGVITVNSYIGTMDGTTPPPGLKKPVPPTNLSVH